MRLHFAIDFDGTIALDDTTDLLLDRRADPAWLEVEKEWVAGRIGSRECLVQQAALIRATPEELHAALLDVAIDPDFVPFVAAANRAGATMQVVSDGFDRCILPVLERAGVHLPVTCNRLRPVGGDRWAAEFPSFASDCQSMSGVCKCEAAMRKRTLVRRSEPMIQPQFGKIEANQKAGALMQRYEHRLQPEFGTTDARQRTSALAHEHSESARALVLIGDGRSDFCLASRADVVLAKGKLAAHCAENNFPFSPINSFADVLDWLQPFLAEQVPHTFPRP
jgi:2-hydroxy-3-keto-5-methylthiopentenyl-1-phosphate phosphatase